LLQFSAAPDKAREPASRSGLEAGAGGTDTYQLKCLDRFTKSLDRHRAERVDLNKAIDQAQRRSSKLDSAWRRELLHAGC
jgi:hypothetical protein